MAGWVEALESRCLLSDIHMMGMSADGFHTLTLNYEITGEAATAFGVGVYRSVDTVFDGGDSLVSQVTLSDPADLSVGTHQKQLTIGLEVQLPGAGADEVNSDYYLLGVADPGNAIAESDETNNTAVFSGAYHVAGGDLLVHGTDGADAIQVAPGAKKTLTLTLNGATFPYAAADVSGVDVRAHGGDDVVSGAKVAVSLAEWGGMGNDTLTGGTGADVLDGGDGNDQLAGLAGNDTLLGGAGDDSLDGGAGADWLDGGAGDDTLVGGAGNDILNGGPGTNDITGGAGSDTWAVQGTSGDDQITVDTDIGSAQVVTGATTLQDDTFEDLTKKDAVLSGGGDGNDTIEVDGSVPATLLGGNGNDVLSAGDGNDTLDGGAGDDQLYGMGGNDWLFGGRGDDILDGGDGSNTIVGSGGSDSITPGGGKNKLLFSGIGQAAATPALRFSPADSTPPVSLSFSFDLPVSGGFSGFSGTADATVNVQGTLDQNGLFTGTASATGSGAAEDGAGDSVTFTFGASGDVSGPLNRLLIFATWSGSGSGTNAMGDPIGGSASGPWSGMISLGGPSSSEKFTSSSSDFGSFRLAGNAPAPDFDINSPDTDVVGGGSGGALSGLFKAPAQVASTIGAEIVLNDPRVNKRKDYPSGFSVFDQIAWQAAGFPVHGATGNVTWVNPRTYQLIESLADAYGNVTVNELTGGKHGTGFDDGGLSRHYKGLAMDLGEVGPYNFYGADATTYGDAIIDMYNKGLLPGSKDVWEIGLGVSGKSDLANVVSDFMLTEGGTLHATAPVLSNGIWSIIVKGKDDAGNSVNLKFKTDDPNHLHIGLPRS